MSVDNIKCARKNHDKMGNEGIKIDFIDKCSYEQQRFTF